MEYHSTIKMKNILFHLQQYGWNLEDIMLSEISQRKTKTVCYHFCVESKEIKQTIECDKKETDSQRTNQWLPVERGKWGGVR